MNDNWKTPIWLMVHFKKHFDPCPFTLETDNLIGLETNWRSPAFVNPPYSNPLVWVKKALEEQQKGVDVVMLLRCDPSTKWYRMLIEANVHIAYFNERLKFSESKDCPNFSSMLVYLEGKKSLVSEENAFSTDKEL